jgi:hypothetical protein
VRDFDEAEAELPALRAGKPDHQPGEGTWWRVLTDPAGHPFCLVMDRESKPS